ncbi:hypothetical protein T03_16878 [Trichinella britovi]|uniref:Uncharacterized protein n=1 Tax=Trichinella britovi TaxID=45882 RepID=A0A0V1C5U1_TRIBR|nr:hypothetical protein T03_13638 [Trichinella britovi]KRY45645.1 hypothetical protein T03_16878 [Trichinella britovi]
MAKYGEQARPKHTRVRRYVAIGPPGPSFLHRKRQTSRSSSRNPTCRNIFAISDWRATLKRRNRSRIPSKSACSFSPESSCSFSDVPLNFTEASNTMRCFVAPGLDPAD